MYTTELDYLKKHKLKAEEVRTWYICHVVLVLCVCSWRVS